jgi:hypothetical protein
MPRRFTDPYEAAVYCNRRLAAVKARIEADIECAKDRRDLVRAYRYVSRLSLLEYRRWTTTPCEVTPYKPV